MEFSRQEYWSGLPFPLPGNIPDPGIEPMFLMSPALAGGFFTTEPHPYIYLKIEHGILTLKLYYYIFLFSRI